MSKGPKCGNTKHKPMDGECQVCGDEFPCRKACDHLDCKARREACCANGMRWNEETGEPPEAHPGDCYP